MPVRPIRTKYAFGLAISDPGRCLIPRNILALFPRTVDKVPVPSAKPEMIRTPSVCVNGIMGVGVAKLLILLGVALPGLVLAGERWGAEVTVQRLQWTQCGLAPGWLGGGRTSQTAAARKARV